MTHIQTMEQQNGNKNADDKDATEKRESANYTRRQQRQSAEKEREKKECEWWKSESTWD